MISENHPSNKDIVRSARQIYQAQRSMVKRQSTLHNLDKLWEVLESIRGEGGRDYSLAEVGRRLETIGGPKTQSLRNAQGSRFREIISAYAAAVNGATRYMSQNQTNVERALDMIADPSVRATLRMALEERKRLKVVNDNLHAAFKNLQVGISLGTDQLHTASPLLVEPSAPAHATYQPLSPRLLGALRKGIDVVRLTQQGLRICDDGSIANEHGDKVFPPSFVTAIKLILGETVDKKPGLNEYRSAPVK